MAEKFNILRDRLIPVLLADGSRTLISAREMALTQDGRVPVSLDFAHEFLNDVGQEFLGGVLQLAMAPRDGSQWQSAWKAPPSHDDFQAILEPLIPFFNVFGSAPAFQVAAARDDARSKSWPIRRLARDLGEEGGVDRTMGLSAGAIASFGLQAHAHSGGRGYNTSLSAGGPLRTVPDMGHSLFQKVWGSVLEITAFDALGDGEGHELSDHFPWTAPPRGEATRADSAPGTVYFATPRRILLEEANSEGECPIGSGSGPLLTTVIEGPGGTSYPSHSWEHPLTPYRRDQNGLMLPYRAANYASGVCWADRIGLFEDSDDDKGPLNRQASIIRAARVRFRRLGEGGLLRIKAYGQRYENASYVGPMRSVQPIRLMEAALAKPHEMQMRKAVACASAIQVRLRSCLTEAQMSDLSTNDKERSLLRKTRIVPQSWAFWDMTQDHADQFDADVASYLEAHGVQELEDGQADPLEELRWNLFRKLALGALKTFDQALPEPSSGHYRNHSLARQSLRFLHADSRITDVMDLPNYAPVRERKEKKK